MKITEQASNELKKALENYGQEGSGIRIFTAQGCCGPAIQMDIATQPGNNQTIINIDSLDFFVDKDLMDSLASVTIEYGGNGFRLEGLPKKSSGCCG